MLHKINRSEDLRRLLKRWVLDDPKEYLDHLSNSAEVAKRAGKPFTRETDPNKIADEIAICACEMIRRRDISSLTRKKDTYYKNRKRYERGEPGAPGPETEYGVADWPEDTSYQVKVMGLGSERANDDATATAIFLTDKYLEIRREERKGETPGQLYEESLRLLEQAKRTLATFRSIPTEEIEAEMASEARAKAKKDAAEAKKSVVTPPLKKPTTPIAIASTRRWRSASEREKLEAMCSAIHAGGQGLSISIDLDPSTVTQAKNAGKASLSHLRDRFTKLLKGRLGHVPDLVLVGEQEVGKKHHIMG